MENLPKLQLVNLLQGYIEGEGDEVVLQLLESYLRSVTDTEIFSIQLELWNKYRKTALTHAAEYEHVDILKCLLRPLTRDEKFDLLVLQDSDGNTAVHAASNHNMAIMECMLQPLTQHQKFHLLRIQDSQGNIALHWAAEYENVNMMKYWLNSLTPDQRFSLLSIKNSVFGNTAVHVAAEDVLEYILHIVTPHQRLDLWNVQNKNGDTAIELARAKRNARPRSMWNNLYAITPIIVLACMHVCLYWAARLW